MIYKDITKIPYTFLRNAVQEISKKYNVCSVRLDPVGEVYVKIKGELEEKDRNSIMDELVKGKDIKPDYHNDWDYSDDREYIYIFTPDGVDYTKL